MSPSRARLSRSRNRASGGSTAPEGMVRLQRFMADAGVASRRRCEELIETGHVEVNGAVVMRLPIFVNPETDKVVIDGRPLRAATGERPADARKVYVMLNKPSGFVCSTKDQFDRPTVVGLVNHPAGARLYPVGRLEFNASGLVLMTNDGELTDRLTHARHGATRTYHVTVKGAIDNAYAADLERGLNIKAERAAREAGGRPGEISVRAISFQQAGLKDDRSMEKTVLEITVRAGKHRHLDDMLAEAGLRATRVEQVGLGPLALKGLAVGEWRELDRNELVMLRKPFDAKPADAVRRPRPTPTDVSIAPSRAALAPGPAQSPRSAPGVRTSNSRPSRNSSGSDRGSGKNRGPNRGQNRGQERGPKNGPDRRSERRA